jgi:hypothetical protein
MSYYRILTLSEIQGLRLEETLFLDFDHRRKTASLGRPLLHKLKGQKMEFGEGCNEDAFFVFAKSEE